MCLLRKWKTNRYEQIPVVFLFFLLVGNGFINHRIDKLSAEHWKTNRLIFANSLISLCRINPRTLFKPHVVNNKIENEKVLVINPTSIKYNHKLINITERFKFIINMMYVLKSSQMSVIRSKCMLHQLGIRFNCNL